VDSPVLQNNGSVFIPADSFGPLQALF